LPRDIRDLIAEIARAVFAHGRLEDRVLALELAGSVPAEELIPLLRAAISFGSELLDDVAFRQLRRLDGMPAFLSRWIRLDLIGRFLSGQLRYQRKPLEAFLVRVRDDGRLLSNLKLLIRIATIDWLLHVAFAACFVLIADRVDIGTRLGYACALTSRSRKGTSSVSSLQRTPNQGCHAIFSLLVGKPAAAGFTAVASGLRTQRNPR
jgi:hypothetical protein